MATNEPVSLFESFENDFGDWTVGSYLHPDHHAELKFSVTPTQTVAEDGRWSLEFTAVGHHDDGTVWIEREVHLTPGVWDVSLSFHLFDEFDSDVNNWEVVAYIDFARPEVEEDFVWIGETGVAGWTEYTLERTLSVDEPAAAHFALGINITWESVRTYWIDSVLIEGIPPLPCSTPGDLNGDGAVDVQDLLILLSAWGPCGKGDCSADLNGSGTVDVQDLLILLANWGS